ncbi:MAG: hypothetical protein ABI899_05565, partial [Actinomycetota bacterium]
MNTSLDVLSRRSTPPARRGAARPSTMAAAGKPPRIAGRHVSVRRPSAPRWWRDASGVFAWCSMLVVV